MVQRASSPGEEAGAEGEGEEAGAEAEGEGEETEAMDEEKDARCPACPSRDSLAAVFEG